MHHDIIWGGGYLLFDVLFGTVEITSFAFDWFVVCVSAEGAFRTVVTRSIYSSTLSLAIRFATSIRSLIAWIVMDSVAFLVASRIFKTFVSCFVLRARGLSNSHRVLLRATCFTGKNLLKHTKNGSNSRKI